MKQKASTDMEAQKPEEAKKPKGTRKSKAAGSPNKAESAKAAEEPKEEESAKTTRKPRATRKSNAAESPKEAESAKAAEEPKEEESPKTTRKPRATRKAKTSESTKEPESVKEVEDTKAAESPKEAEKPVKKPRTARATKAKKEQDVVEATPVKPARRRIAKAEKIDYVEYEPTAKPIEVAEEPKEESDGLEDAMEKLERITKSSPFAKYDAMLEDDDDDDDDEPKVVVPRPVARVSPVATISTTSTRAPRGKSRKRDGDEEFLIPDDSAKIAELNKGNAWSYEVEQIYEMLLEGRHTEHWAENEVHFMNIIKPVFDVKFVDRTDENLITTLEEQGFYVNVYPKSRDDMNNAIALRKHQIRKITDLTMENILHLTPREVLDLIEENMGTGWQGLPLPIQDIIETGFYVDSTVMPAAAMHRAGGIIDRRKADGYEVLEVERGTWIEGIFLKYKPRQEKRHFEAISDINRRQYDDGDDENDDDDDLIDENEDDDELDDDDDQMEEQDPQYEEFEDIPVEDDEE